MKFTTTKTVVQIIGVNTYLEGPQSEQCHSTFLFRPSSCVVRLEGNHDAHQK
jgi:hypothetical protein